MNFDFKQTGMAEKRIAQRRIVMISFFIILLFIVVLIVIEERDYSSGHKTGSAGSLFSSRVSSEYEVSYGGDTSSGYEFLSQTGGVTEPVVSDGISITGINSGIHGETSGILASSSNKSSIQYVPVTIEKAKTKETIKETMEFFKLQIPFLRHALEQSEGFYCEKLLDEVTATKAYILAKNDNYAQNLNGYFYYLFDEEGSTTIVSPFVLNISLLFDEENRQESVKSGSYAEKKYTDALRDSLIAALGRYYSDEVFKFIYTEYQSIFKSRLDDNPIQNSVYKFQVSKLEVLFHNSFITYVEFFITP